MASGTVKFFNTQKGFGFITPSDGSRDVFVHISAVERAGMSSLNEGQRLTYDVVTERGKQAASNLQNARSQFGSRKQVHRQYAKRFAGSHRIASIVQTATSPRG
jgi:CspA family cold shock protein